MEAQLTRLRSVLLYETAEPYSAAPTKLAVCPAWFVAFQRDGLIQLVRIQSVESLIKMKIFFVKNEGSQLFEQFLEAILPWNPH